MTTIASESANPEGSAGSTNRVHSEATEATGTAGGTGIADAGAARAAGTASGPAASGKLLSVQSVSAHYGQGRHRFQAVKNVSLDIARGQCAGLVGESGSGKSTLGKLILGLETPSAGHIFFDGNDITSASPRARRELARSIQVVFQDPYGSLNPAMTVGQILAEPLTVMGTSRAQARTAVSEMLDRVRMPENSISRYPNEFSGGQRQRIAIARALVRKPRLIVCDEPVSALDLTTQATIIDLLIELQRETGVAYLFISHDLSVVRRICHSVAVMYRGEIVEQGPGELVTSAPTHPYSQRLLMASPIADPQKQKIRREEWLKVRAGASLQAAALEV